MYTCNLQSYLCFFFLDNWIDQRFEDTELAVRDCSDAGKVPIGNMTECQEAASSLGYMFVPSASIHYYPKGCFKLCGGGMCHVWWNNHETGSKTSYTFAICKSSGKYLLVY